MQYRFLLFRQNDRMTYIIGYKMFIRIFIKKSSALLTSSEAAEREHL